MKTLAAVTLVLMITALAVSTSHTSGTEKNNKFIRSENAVQGRYIVVLHDAEGLSENGVGEMVSDLAKEFPGSVGDIFSHALKGYSAEMSPESAEELSMDPRVRYVEEDVMIEPQSVQENATWGIARIDQRDFANPIDTRYNYSATGAGVSVYVIDTGILTTHPDFGGRAYSIYDPFNDNIAQCNGHGTHVAGTIGSATFGVAKNVTLYSVKVFPCSGGATSSQVIAGVDLVARRASGPSVANMSLGGGSSTALEDAVQGLIDRGVTVTVAAGNSARNACEESPARLPAAITVGATHNSDSRDENTNYGSCIDLFAPGVAVISTWNTQEWPTIPMSGTSTAAPHAAGVAALYLETNPAASPAAVSSAIVGNATPGAVYNAGPGSPNLLLFSTFAAGPAPTPPPPGGCSGAGYNGYIPVAGMMEYQSSSAGFAGRSGTFNGSLQAPAATQFRLALERKQGQRWSRVAVSSGTSPEQTISYRGKSGTYRWQVAAVAGSGEYSLCSRTP